MPQYKTVVSQNRLNSEKGQLLGRIITSISCSQSWMLAGGFCNMARKKHHKDKREPGAFAPVSRFFLDSHVRKNLSMKANTLLMDLLAQYNGFNNGDLCLAWKIMKEYNWRSRQTLDRAREELLEKEILMLTRQGGRNSPSLFALTIYNIDDCRDKWGHTKIDVQPTKRPTRAWIKHEPMPKLKTLTRRPGQGTED
jgi:hypothetical protein